MSEKSRSKGALHQAATVSAIVSFYWVVSMSLVFANKWVMKTYDFNYPLFLTWFQLLVAELFIIIFGILSSRVGGIFSTFAPLEWDWKIANGTLPLTFIWLSMMAASNICLRYSEVTFYQVVRALTILWSLIFQRIQFPEFVVGWERGVACIIVMIGFTIGSYGEINFHWIGFFSGLLSSVLVAYYNNSIKKALSFVDQSSWRLMIYNTTIAIPIFIPILYFTDELIINNEVAYQKLSPIVWQGIILSGVLGYLINLAIFLQIQLTSPLTGTISGTVKGVLQVLFGWLIFRNEISIMNGFGIILVLVGSTYYSWIGYRTSAQKQLDQELKDGDKEKGAV